MLRDKVFRVRSTGKVTMHHPTPYARVHVSNPRAGNVTFGRTLEDAWPLAPGATMAVPGKPRACPEIRCWSEKFEVGGRQGSRTTSVAAIVRVKPVQGATRNLSK